MSIRTKSKWERAGEARRLTACFLIAVMIRHIIVHFSAIRATVGLICFFVILATALLAVLFVLWARRRSFRYRTEQEISAMDQDSFEDYLVRLFIKLGYRIRRQDHVQKGCILIQKRKRRIHVHALKTKGPVGTKSLEELLFCMKEHACDGLIISTSGYTVAARTMAKEQNIGIWDWDCLNRASLIAKGSDSLVVSPALHEE